MSAGYSIEVLPDEQVFIVKEQMEGQPIEVLVPPGSKILEVHNTSPTLPIKIGGTNPVNDPTVLVWYDTQGAR